MIVGIGCDLVEHALTKKLKWTSDEKIRSRIFSQEELSLCPQEFQIAYLSGRFAAKEAVLKCLGTGMAKSISLTDIEVLYDKLKKPIIKLTGEALKLSSEKEISDWHVSLSHSDNYSIATVIAEHI